MPEYRPNDLNWLQQYGLERKSRVQLAPYVELSLDPTSNPRKLINSVSHAKHSMEFGATLPEWSIEERLVQGLIAKETGASVEEYLSVKKPSFPLQFTYSRALSLMEFCQIQKTGGKARDQIQIQYALPVFIDENEIAPNGATLMEARISIKAVELEFLKEFSERAPDRSQATGQDSGHPMRFNGDGRYHREFINPEIRKIVKE